MTSNLYQNLVMLCVLLLPFLGTSIHFPLAHIHRDTLSMHPELHQSQPTRPRWNRDAGYRRAYLHRVRRASARANSSPSTHKEPPFFGLLNHSASSLIITIPPKRSVSAQLSRNSATGRRIYMAPRLPASRPTAGTYAHPHTHTFTHSFSLIFRRTFHSHPFSSLFPASFVISFLCLYRGDSQGLAQTQDHERIRSLYVYRKLVFRKVCTTHPLRSEILDAGRFCCRVEGRGRWSLGLHKMASQIGAIAIQ